MNIQPPSIQIESESQAGRSVSRDKLRIGIFTDTYAPQINGIAISLQLLVRGLREIGHEVTVFAPRLPDHRDSETNVYRLPALRYMQMPPVYIAIPGTPRATLMLRRSQFDVLHVHSPLTVGMLAYITAYFKHIPVVYTYHVSMTDYTHYLKFGSQTRPVLWATRWFSRVTTNLSDQVIVPSAKFKRILNEQHVIRPIRLIPNGIDLGNFHVSKSPGTYRRRLGLNTNQPLLVFTGRLAPEKRIDILIEAFDRIGAQYPDAHFVIAGDGNSRPQLERQAGSCKYAQRIHFLGMVARNDLPDLLHDATLFMSASTSEVHPIAMIEAAAAGLPIVAVWDDAFEDLLVDGQNGCVTSRDVNAFSAAVCSILADDAVRQEYGRTSMELSRKFAIETQIDALIDLYREMVDSNTSRRKIS